MILLIYQNIKAKKGYQICEEVELKKYIVPNGLDMESAHLICSNLVN